MRVCLVYDCLFPYTIGGAERWYRSLAERLVRAGHEVTYLTLRQWNGDPETAVSSVRVVAVAPRMALYARSGRRRLVPPLVFGAGVLWHLGRHGRRYDVVHTASFPYFSLLAAAAARRLHGFALVVDWFELWTLPYWREYLGTVGGWAGWHVQRRCVRVRQRAFSFARLTAERLRAEGAGEPVTVLEGLYDGPAAPRPSMEVGPLVVFAGRHIPEKRPSALVPALARARTRVPGLRGRILGDGPRRGAVVAEIAAHGLESVVDAPGFVSAEELDAALGSALCLVLPSRREGYGIVVVEAAARGTPSILVEGADNAALDLIEPGVNGIVATSSDPDDLADAIVAVHVAGRSLRESTAAWFARNAERLSVSRSVERVLEAYRAAAEASARS